MKKVVVMALLFLLFLNTEAQERKRVSSYWTSFVQGLDIISKKEKKFKITASVKVETNEKEAWAGVWARVDNKNEETGFFDNMGDRPIKSNEWQTYSIEGVINSNSKRLNFGGICMMNGKFYFDDYKLFIENDKGVLEAVSINNNGFEKEVSNGAIPKWSYGISKTNKREVEGYEITSIQDAAEGGFALLIEGRNIKNTMAIGKYEGASPQIGAMITMLENLKTRVVNRVQGLSQYEIDHLHDEKANRIGALVMHLAAAEAYYQVFTFEGRGFNEDEKKKWESALNLGEKAREEFKGHDINYYLDIYSEVRAKTIEELKKRNDAWFEKTPPGRSISNHFSWFHVMEHQSSHLGQILFLAKRIPPEPEVVIPKKELD